MDYETLKTSAIEYIHRNRDALPWSGNSYDGEYWVVIDQTSITLEQCIDAMDKIRYRLSIRTDTHDTDIDSRKESYAVWKMLNDIYNAAESQVQAPALESWLKNAKAGLGDHPDSSTMENWPVQ